MKQSTLLLLSTIVIFPTLGASQLLAQAPPGQGGGLHDPAPAQPPPTDSWTPPNGAKTKHSEVEVLGGPGHGGNFHDPVPACPPQPTTSGNGQSGAAATADKKSAGTPGTGASSPGTGGNLHDPPPACPPPANGGDNNPRMQSDNGAKAGGETDSRFCVRRADLEENDKFVMRPASGPGGGGNFHDPQPAQGGTVGDTPLTTPHCPKT